MEWLLVAGNRKQFLMFERDRLASAGVENSKLKPLELAARVSRCTSVVVTPATPATPAALQSVPTVG